MEELKQRFLEEWWPAAKAFVASLSMEEWIVIGATLFVLLLLRIILRRRKKGRKPVAPQAVLPSAPVFELKAFQVAPLGKDAYFRITNAGEKATLSNLQVKGRSDIVIKNVVAGHQVSKGGEYGVLLEINSRDKIRPDFWLTLSYSDEQGNTFQQDFNLQHSEAQKPRLVGKS